MGPPSGPASARGPAGWIHWWSRVASAKASTLSWVIWNQSLTPISPPMRVVRAGTSIVLTWPPWRQPGRWYALLGLAHARAGWLCQSGGRQGGTKKEGSSVSGTIERRGAPPPGGGGGGAGGRGGPPRRAG